MEKANNKLIEYLPFICSRCKNIKVPGMETEDIQQEAAINVLEYLRECYATDSEPEDGAVKNIVHRHFFRLIRDNVTFEGCSPESKKVRRMLARPFSPNVPSKECEEDINLLESVPFDSDNPYETFSNLDILEKFQLELTPTEKTIFSFMRMGLHKPREICKALHGEKNLCAAKTISNHTIKIRKKFEVFWKQEVGKIICLN